MQAICCDVKFQLVPFRKGACTLPPKAPSGWAAHLIKQWPTRSTLALATAPHAGKPRTRTRLAAARSAICRTWRLQGSCLRAERVSPSRCRPRGGRLAPHTGRPDFLQQPHPLGRPDFLLLCRLWRPTMALGRLGCLRRLRRLRCPPLRRLQRLCRQPLRRLRRRLRRPCRQPLRRLCRLCRRLRRQCPTSPWTWLAIWWTTKRTPWKRGWWLS